MFNNRNNFRRSVKHKQPKNTKKTPQYVEDYNEVILNDLVDENKVDEVNAEEEPARKAKKKKGINLTLANKKKSTTTESNKKSRPSDKKHKKYEPEEIIEIDNKKEESKSQQTSQQNVKSKKKNSKQSKFQSKKNSNKKTQSEPQEESMKKTHHKSSKKHSIENKEENHKKHNKRRVKKEEEKVNLSSLEDENIANEEVNEVPEEIVDLGVFRNISSEEIERKDTQEIENDMAKEDSEHKFNNIVWSDDSFPKD